MTYPERARGVRLLDELGLIAVLLPELLPMKGLPQGLPATPAGDLWDHVLRTLDLLGPEASFPLALAVLLHDVGKPRTRRPHGGALHLLSPRARRPASGDGNLSASEALQ